MTIQNKKIKISFIGGGNTIQEHAKVFSTFKEVSMSGIYNRTQKKAQFIAKKFNIKNAYESVEDLYKKTKSDAVVVAVSVDATKKICEKIFKYPWICLIEKPIGYNLSEAIYLEKLAKKYNAKVFAAFNRRHYISTKNLLKKIVKYKGKRLIEINDQQNQFNLKKIKKRVVSNWMFANSIHLIDYFNILGRGKIKKIKVYNRWKNKKKCSVFAKILFSSGDVGIYKSLWNSPGLWSVKITTNKKKFELKPLERLLFQKVKSKNFKSSNLNYHFDKMFKPGFRNQAYELIKVAKSKKSLLPSIKDALKTMRLINSIYCR